MKNHTISIAMTVYNNSTYLTKQLESIINQTVYPDEIVICEDCSTDPKVKEILKDFENICPFNCKIIYNDTNLGSIRNIEKSFSLCSNDIIIHCDSDDIWENDKIERIDQSFSDDTMLVFHDAMVIDSRDDLIHNSWIDLQNYRKNMKLDSEGFILNAIKYHIYPYGMSTAFRSTLLEHLIPFYTVDDQWVALIAPLFGNVVYIDEKLIKYRRHNANVSGNSILDSHTSKLKKIKNVIKLKKQISKEKWFQYPDAVLKCFKEYIAKFNDKITPDIVIETGNIIKYNRVIKEIISGNKFIGIFKMLYLFSTGLYKQYRANINSMIIDLLFII